MWIFRGPRIIKLMCVKKKPELFCEHVCFSDRCTIMIANRDLVKASLHIIILSSHQVNNGITGLPGSTGLGH